MADHYFESWGNPNRSPLSCRWCGKLPSMHPKPPVPFTERDLDAEDAIIEFVSSDPATRAALSQMWNMAQTRAHDGGIRMGGRDFLREVREELADAVNYLVWECVYGGLTDRNRVLRLSVIVKLAEAWALLS